MTRECKRESLGGFCNYENEEGRRKGNRWNRIFSLRGEIRFPKEIFLWVVLRYYKFLKFLQLKEF